MSQALAHRRTIQSITGYGRASRRTSGGMITVELRSTNHRYLEIDQRLSNGLSGLQSRVAQQIRGVVRRGRVEVAVVAQLDRSNDRRIVFDEALLRRYHDVLVDLKARFGLAGRVTLEHLLALPQAISVAETPSAPESVWDSVEQTLKAALQELVQARRQEGGKLVKDLRGQLQAIERHLRAVKRRLPEALRQQRHAMRQRLRELLGPQAAGSSSQIEQAAALVRDADIHEELVRLESHLGYMRQTLVGEPLVGKRLDFIAQELMREANTMGAKLNDPQAAQSVVAIKECIEKIREQVQNLE